MGLLPGGEEPTLLHPRACSLTRPAQVSLDEPPEPGPADCITRGGGVRPDLSCSPHGELRRPKQDMAYRRRVPPRAALRGRHASPFNSSAIFRSESPRTRCRWIRRTTLCGSVGGRPSLTPRPLDRERLLRALSESRGPKPSHRVEGEAVREGIGVRDARPCRRLASGSVAACSGGLQRVSRKVIVPVCLGPSTMTASPRAPR